jgi:hypothetical protein
MYTQFGLANKYNLNQDESETKTKSYKSFSYFLFKKERERVNFLHVFILLDLMYTRIVVGFCSCQALNHLPFFSFFLPLSCRVVMTYYTWMEKNWEALCNGDKSTESFFVD